MKIIRPDQRYSAALLIRWHRPQIGLRAAYWLAVYRYGWTNWARYADEQLSRLLRPKYGHAYAAILSSP